MNARRNYKFDNLRCLLIFLVVFGHMIERSYDPGIVGWNIYTVLYTFHVPALFFVSGIFAKFNPRRIITKIFLPYILFQSFYLFQEYICTPGSEFKLSFTTPHLSLWYILVLGFYYILIPFFESDRIKSSFVILAVCFIISILVGFDDSVGYYLSLSRALVFLPFFVCGLYWGKYSNEDLSFELVEKHKFLIGTILAVLIVVFEYRIVGLRVLNAVLYCSYSYASTETGAALRIFVACCAFLWILFLIIICPKRKIFLVSDIGQNTLIIYLLHDIIRWLLWKYNFLNGTPLQNIIGAGATAVAVLIGFYMVSVGWTFIKKAVLRIIGLPR